MVKEYIQTEENIKDLGVSLESLYKNEYQVNIHLSDSKHVYTLILNNFRGLTDCKISSFSANLWIRTEAGIKKAKYKRFQDLQREVKKAIYKKVANVGTINFSLSDEISYL